MTAYKFKVAYQGTHYCGWQIQPNAPTVQEELQKALKIITREDVHVIGSGRTDTGVHSSGQVARFDLRQGQDHPIDKLERSLNGLLPKDIAVRDLEICDDDFQPRFDAISRYYIYTIYTRKTAFAPELGWFCPFQFDVDLFESAAQDFLGTHDFIDFCIPRDDGKPTLCIIQEVRVQRFDGKIEFHLRGNRFLHRMVRAMVGLLMEIARGKQAPNTVQECLQGVKKATRIWAPPEGLNLVEVRYE